MSLPSRGRQSDTERDSKPPHVLDVAPLSVAPGVGTFMQVPDEVNVKPNLGPSMVFLTSHPSEFEWNKIMSSSKFALGLSGSAMLGMVGPIVGPIDIGESDEFYFFRVSLPGVARDHDKFSFDIKPDGEIVIKGETTTGEKTVYKNSLVFEMITQNLCPPGPFSIKFHLPGPVDPNKITATFGTDGVLQGMATKRPLHVM